MFYSVSFITLLSLFVFVFAISISISISISPGSYSRWVLARIAIASHESRTQDWLNEFKARYEETGFNRRVAATAVSGRANSGQEVAPWGRLIRVFRKLPAWALRGARQSPRLRLGHCIIDQLHAECRIYLAAPELRCPGYLCMPTARTIVELRGTQESSREGQGKREIICLVNLCKNYAVPNWQTDRVIEW